MGLSDVLVLEFREQADQVIEHKNPEVRFAFAFPRFEAEKNIHSLASLGHK